MLIVNAWELALKAALRQAGKTVFYRKNRGEQYRSFTLDDCLNKITDMKLWPVRVDGHGTTANIKALAEFRNRAIHLYNTPGLGTVIHPFLQQNVLNYRDFMLERFNKDLADSMTWQLLPLGATAPTEAVRFMRTDPGATSPTEVREFIEVLRGFMDEAEAAGGEMFRVATLYDINMQSSKQITSADLVVAINTMGDGQVVVRKTDPNQTHPYRMGELLKRANKKRDGRELTTHDFTVICWKENLRENTKYAWKHGHDGSHVWSGDAVTYFAKLSDSYCDQIRKEYRDHQKKQKESK